jgi:hypothetical protein
MSSRARPGRSPNTKTIRHFASEEQSSTSGIGSSRHAKACIAHLLAYLIRRIRSNLNKSTASSGEAIKKIARQEGTSFASEEIGPMRATTPSLLRSRFRPAIVAAIKAKFAGQ